MNPVIPPKPVTRSAKTEKLSQQKLLEVLTAEIEDLKKATKDINQVAPVVHKQLEELKKTTVRVQVDTSPLERFSNHLEQRLKSAIVIPQWTLYVWGFLLLWSILSSILAYTAMNKAQENATASEEWMKRAQMFEEKLARKEQAQAEALERINKRRK